MRKQSLPVRILGTGVYLPTNRRDSAFFDMHFQKPAGWSENRFHIRSRAVANTETTVDMAVAAAAMALRNADLKPQDLDLVVSACSVMHQPIPTTAHMVHERLGLGSIATPVLDINATCLGFVSALDVLSYSIAAGRYGRVLIVNSEMPSSGLNWSDPEASVIFGDGAAAIVVSGDKNQKGSGILASVMSTHSDGVDFCQIRSGGTRIKPTENSQAFVDGARFELKGKAAFKLAARHIGKNVNGLLEEAGLEITDIDVVVPHQASALALHHLRRNIGFSSEQVIDIFVDHGNQVSASIPTALHRGIESGRIERGHKVMLIGTSAGISIGGMILEY